MVVWAGGTGRLWWDVCSGQLLLRHMRAGHDGGCCCVPQVLQSCHVESLPAGAITLGPRQTVELSLFFR